MKFNNVLNLGFMILICGKKIVEFVKGERVLLLKRFLELEDRFLGWVVINLRIYELVFKGERNRKR